MSKEQETVLMIRGMISSLPLDQREACEELAEFIRMNVKKAGPVGGLALALVGAEMQMQSPEEP